MRRLVFYEGEIREQYNLVEFRPTTFESHDILENLKPENNVIPFMQARSVVKAQDLPSGVTVTPLILTSRRAWGKVNFREEINKKPEERAELKMNPGIDNPGPLSLAVAATIPLGENISEKRNEKGGRIVVIGDSDMIQNGNVQSTGRIDLVLNSIRWLAEQEHLISGVRHIKPQDYRLKNWVNQRHISIIFWIVIVFMPLFICALGFWVWFVRRK
jgi:hypothetical protein